jgi:hypothetical protein
MTNRHSITPQITPILNYAGFRKCVTSPRAGSITAAARELARYKLDLVGVQEVRWDKGGTVRARDYIFLYGNGNEIIGWEQVLLYTKEKHQQLRE